MSGSVSNIIVIGGGSRIAAALIPRLSPTASYISRRQIGGAQEILVSDYDSILPSALDGARCVVNCVGASAGDITTLLRINFDMPRSLAIAAKTAGVQHLIHISSFSVYGSEYVVDRGTPTGPTSDYGRSKLAGDRALLALADENFAVTILRLPMIYGPEGLGRLGQLLRLWKSVRFLPVPAGDISRAMISVDLAAEVISELTQAPQTGVYFAADPRPFTYADAARARAEHLGRFLLPRFFTQWIQLAIPPIGNRLFADSRLVSSDNLAVRYNLKSRLYSDIAAADFD